VHAAHIVKHVDETHTEEEARAGIEAALAELESGEPFAAVAERHSDCKGNGGDLGLCPRGKMVQEFEDVVFAIEPGRRSPVFRTPFGFHIAEVRAKAPGGIADLGEVRHVIEPFLAAMNERNALQRVIAGLRAEADIRRISTREAERLGAQRAAS
jgi:parvulin-like peptidyl-prolyl isomerase